MRISKAEQGTDQWRKDRAGVVTASEFYKVLAKIKTGEAAIRYNYKAELVAERLTGLPTERFITKEMQWGTDHEPEARAVYAAIKEVEVVQTGLIKHAEWEVGASPDGLVGKDGLVEIKCPNTATHIMTILTEKIPKQYYAQMQGQMWITETKWCDFVSYDPRLDAKRAIHIIRVERDDDFIDGLQEAVLDFIEEVDELTEQLEAIK